MGATRLSCVFLRYLQWQRVLEVLEAVSKPRGSTPVAWQYQRR